MMWLRQWKARDVLKLLAVVLPALLFVGAGLGWIMHEYHRQAVEKSSDRADVATMKFYRETQDLLEDLSSGPLQHVRAQRLLESRLASFVARRGGQAAPFPSATAAFLWNSGRMLWSTNLVGDCQYLATTPFKTSIRLKSLGVDNLGWQPLRELGADSDAVVVWSRNKRGKHVCGLVVGPPGEEELPSRTGYVVAGVLLAGVGLLLLAGGVSLAVTVLRARGEMERRNTFVSNAAHEVKTPLASILLRAERLVDGAYETEERRTKAAGVILEQGRELRRRIERLRDFDRLERGMRTYDRQAFDLGEAVRETARPLEERFEAHGLDLAGVASVRMVGDRDSVMEIVENLLTNAAKYAAHVGPVSVCVAQAENGRTAVVRVLDGGPGLSGAQLRRVFDRDWRASNDLTKSVGGWGVGLAFARDLARDMGGDLSVAARPDGGCAFTLELPLGTETEKEAT